MIGHLDSIETLGLVDGPGIRVVIFMQGCKLRCLFCHNPETWTIDDSMVMTPRETLDFVLRYQNYFGEDGGVTFSGGEPLLQPEYLLETLKLCKEHHIHTVLDTAGVGFGHYREILSYVDLVILDVKALSVFDYQKMTGRSMEGFKEFLAACEESEKPLWLRQVIVPGINDTEEYVRKLKNFGESISGVEKIELLPYHTMGVSKYEELCYSYPLKGVPALSEERLHELETILYEK